MNRWSDVHLLSLARLLSLVWRWLTDVRKKMPEKRLDVNRGSFDYPVLSPVIECCSGLLKISSSFSLHLSFNLEKQKQNGNRVDAAGRCLARAESRLQYAEVIPGCSIPQTIKHSRKTNNSWDYRITITLSSSGTISLFPSVLE